MIRALLLSLALVSVAVAQSTPRKMFLPGHSSIGQSSVIGAANTLYCWTGVAESNLVVHKMAAYFPGSHAATTCGVGLYPNSDIVGSVGAFSKSCGTGGVVGDTTQDFVVTAGTLYRQCLCATASNVISYAAVQQALTCCQDTNLTQLLPVFGTAPIGTAANPCVAGVPPITTGVITPEVFTFGRQARRFPVFLVEE